MFTHKSEKCQKYSLSCCFGYKTDDYSFPFSNFFVFELFQLEKIQKEKALLQELEDLELGI